MTGLEMKYFVLKPKGNTVYHRASREALRTYAAVIEEVNEPLAQDLCQWADETFEKDVT